MNTLTLPMQVNDRVCMSIVGQREPYNILRVIEVGSDSCKVYLSLLKKDPLRVISLDNPLGTHLRGKGIVVKVLGIDKGNVALVFTGEDDIKFRRLQRRESLSAS